MKRLGLSLLIASAISMAAFVSTASAGLLFAPEYSGERVNVLDNAHPGGSLTAVAGSPFATAMGGDTGWAMTPDGKFGLVSFLYGGVRSFSVSAAGAVAPAQDAINWPSNGAYSVAVAPNGKSAYLATRHSPGPGAGGIRGYSISTSGILTELAGSPYIALGNYLDEAVTADGTKIFASDGSSVYRGSIAASGVPAFSGSDPVPGATYLATSPDSRFLFVEGNTAGVTSLKVFAIASDASITQVGATIPLGTGTPRAPGVSADGAFVYATESNSGVISTIRIAPDGSPSLVGTDPFVSGDALLPTADGKYLYVANQGSDNAIRVSQLGANGRPGVFTKAYPYMDGEPIRLSMRPGQGTNADFVASAEQQTLTMRFDASTTTSKLGGLGEFSWVFGAGGVGTGAASVITYTFAKAGVYDITLTAADDAGCTTKFVYTGQSTVCNGSPSSVKTVKVDTPPWITSLKVSPNKVSKKSKIKFVLTEKASVSFYAQKQIKGRTVGTSCRKQTKKNKSAKKCTLWVRASKTFRKSGKVGKTNSMKFTGKVGKAKLPKGSYRLYAVATDSAKGKGPSRTAKFKIK